MVGAVTVAAEELPAQQEIDVVWTKSDGIRPEIFLTTNSGGTWSDPVMVTDDALLEAEETVVAQISQTTSIELLISTTSARLEVVPSWTTRRTK